MLIEAHLITGEAMRNLSVGEVTSFETAQRHGAQQAKCPSLVVGDLSPSQTLCLTVGLIVAACIAATIFIGGMALAVLAEGSGFVFIGLCIAYVSGFLCVLSYQTLCGIAREAEVPVAD